MAIAQERLLLLERRLAALSRGQAELDDAVQIEQHLIRTSINTPRPARAQPFALPREHLAARIREGVPLLQDQPAHIDLHFAADLFGRLVNVLQEHADAEIGDRLERLAAAATDGQLDPQRLFVEAFVNHADHLGEIAFRAGVDPDLLATLARHAVAPVLRAYADHLLPLTEGLSNAQGDVAVWEHGYCPVCGGWPILGELREAEVTPSLRCGACGSGWQVHRPACPYCGNDDPRSRRRLRIEGNVSRMQVSACDRCHGYLKLRRTFDPTPAELLTLDDVASRQLDAAASEHGYHRPRGSGFVIELAVPEEAWIEELDEV